MRLKQSIHLDSMIDDLRHKLTEDTEREDWERRTKAMVILMEARDKMDALGADIKRPTSSHPTSSRPPCGDMPITLGVPIKR